MPATPERDVVDLRHDQRQDRDAPAARDPEKGESQKASRGEEKLDREGGEAPGGNDGGGGKPSGDDTKGRDKDDKGDGDDGDRKAGLWSTLRRQPVAVGIAIEVLIAAIVAGIFWYLHARHFESTDDAFIDARPVAVSPEVSGNIVNVPVTDNQVVHAGDLLAKIDDRDYRASVDQAQAQIDQADANVVNFQAQVKAQQSQADQAAKQVEEAQATLSFAQNQNQRAQELVKTGFGTVQSAQQAASDLQAKQAALDAAVASRVAADRQINVLKAQRKSAEAQLAQARAQKETADANLSRTELHATLDARVTRLTGAVGAVATTSQALMVLVPLDVWVTANFKETQLADMKVGQPVDIEIDAYGKTYPGRVDSLQSGSGTAFSLLPAENATGNYVKVVQRIPVKITFDQRPDVQLGPGMSVVPTATVR